jgi:hypothetical protein
MFANGEKIFAFIRVIRGLFEPLQPPSKTIPVQPNTQAGLKLNPPVPSHEGMTFVLTRCVAIYMTLMACIGKLGEIVAKIYRKTTKPIDKINYR